MNVKKSKCIHLFHSPLVNESRLEKETSSVARLQIADAIDVIGYWKPGLARRQSFGDSITFHRIATFRYSRLAALLMKVSTLFRYPILLLSFPEYCIKAMIFLLWNRHQYIACHNLILLPIAVTGKIICRSRIIYVPHELETHRTGLTGAMLQLSKMIEACCIRFVDSTVVVCEPIARWYEKRYSIPKVHVVPNVPYHPCPGTLVTRTDLFRKEFKIPGEHLIFLYQGLVSRGRGIEELLEVFQEVPPDRHLVIMGYGELSATIKESSKQNPQIHYKEAVPIAEILSWTSSADVGITFVASEMTLSYQYSLSNKFFEYAIGGLFLVVSKNLLEQSRHIEQHGLGVSIEPNVKGLKDLVNCLNKRKIAEVIQKSSDFRKTISWQSFEQVYLDAYLGRNAKVADPEAPARTH